MSIDYNSLKYNLYEILNVAPNAPEKIIKKSFIKLIKAFHPDKNSKLEEEIYYHIIIANDILLHRESREGYDKYLELKANTFNELKTDFNKSVKPLQKINESNIKNYQDKNHELEKQHGYDPSIYKNTKLEASKYNSINIDKEDIKDNSDFNKKFINYKLNGKFKNQIVEYDKTSEITTYSNENYVHINNMDKLYINDSIYSNNFSPLDRAFVLLPILNESL